MTCNICCENFNKIRKQISCIHCQFECCSKCAKKYILSSLNEANCMNCKKQWDREFITNNFTLNFVNNDYKKHREDIILDKNMAMMEETQEYVERLREANSIRDDINKIRKHIMEKYREISVLEHRRTNLLNNKQIKKESNEPKFFGHCPVDKCNGFINSSSVCGICNSPACKKCREIIDINSEEHVCNEDTLANIENIKKKCRNCPKCKVPIFKIDGCKQIWCVNCHIAFDWVTGEISTGVIHNPHYIEWIRKNGGIPINENNGQNIGCDITYYDVERRLNKYDISERYFFIDIRAFSAHIRFHDINNNTAIINNSVDLNNRILFITGEIDKHELKRRLQIKDKKNNKLIEENMILEMFTRTVSDILISKLFNNDVRKYSRIPLEDMSVVAEIIETIKNLIKYTNESLEKMAYKYKTVYKSILYKVDHRGHYNFRYKKLSI